MSSVVNWYEVKPAPVVFITGTESYLASRAIRQLKVLLKQLHPNLEISEVAEGDYSPGLLFEYASPSLFGEPRLVIIHAPGEGLKEDLGRYIQSPADEVYVVLRLTNMVGHSGAIRKDFSKSVLNVSCEELKRDSERSDFVNREFKMAGVSVEPAAVRALVSAFNSDIGELGSACSQLIAPGKKITLEDVEQTFGGRVETNAFKIADAALSGNATEAIRLFRHGFATGIDSVALVAALSMRIRQLARLFNDRNAPAQALGMQPWQVDKARRELAGWSEQALAELVELAALTDGDVKGAARDPEFSIERLLLAMARSN
jgi:DNA polymerase-3 subunit delta